MSADLSFSLSGGTDFNCLIVFGPIAMSWGTSATLAGQFKELKQHFHLSHVVMVGDRGMSAQARITEDIAPAGMDWIHRAARAGDQGTAGQWRLAALAVRSA